MDVVAVAGDIAGFLDVFAPVATFLSGLHHIDAYHPDFTTIRVDVVSGYPNFAAVFNSGNKVLDVILLLFDTLHLLQRVGNMIFRTDVTPVVLVYFDLVLYAGMVAELRFLAFPNQSLDVVPVAPENAGVVGDGVILEAGGWGSAQG